MIHRDRQSQVSHSLLVINGASDLQVEQVPFVTEANTLALESREAKGRDLAATQGLQSCCRSPTSQASG
jgi:hypothetical protein